MLLMYHYFKIRKRYKTFEINSLNRKLMTVNVTLVVKAAVDNFYKNYFLYFF